MPDKLKLSFDEQERLRKSLVAAFPERITRGRMEFNVE